MLSNFWTRLWSMRYFQNGLRLWTKREKVTWQDICVCFKLLIQVWSRVLFEGAYENTWYDGNNERGGWRIQCSIHHRMFFENITKAFCTEKSSGTFWKVDSWRDTQMKLRVRKCYFSTDHLKRAISFGQNLRMLILKIYIRFWRRSEAFWKPGTKNERFAALSKYQSLNITEPQFDEFSKLYLQMHDSKVDFIERVKPIITKIRGYLVNDKANDMKTFYLEIRMNPLLG